MRQFGMYTVHREGTMSNTQSRKDQNNPFYVTQEDLSQVGTVGYEPTISPTALQHAGLARICTGAALTRPTMRFDAIPKREYNRQYRHRSTLVYGAESRHINP